RALAYRRRIEDEGRALVAGLGASRPAHRSGSSKVRQQLALECSTRLDEQAQIDRLMGHPPSVILSELELQPARDLLGGPVFAQLRGDQLAQCRVARELAHLWAPGVAPRASVRISGAITAPAAVAGDLSSHGRRRSSQPRRDSPGRLSSRDPARDLLPLRKSQSQTTAPPRRRSNTTSLGQRAEDRPRR